MRYATDIEILRNYFPGSAEFYMSSEVRLRECMREHSRACMRLADLPDTKFQRYLSAAGACVSGRERVGEQTLEEFCGNTHSWEEDLAWLADHAHDVGFPEDSEFPMEAAGRAENELDSRGREEVED